MKELENGQDKIAKICEVLRKDTLEPAQAKAQEIIAEAKLQAESIVQAAKAKGEEILQNAQAAIEREQHVFQSSLAQASKQGIETLRQTIEQSLFAPQLENLIAQNTSDPKLVARIIEALIVAVEEKGMERNLAAYIPRDIAPEAVIMLLTEKVLTQLKSGSVTIGDFKGGAEVRVIDKKLRVEMGDEALKELLTTFIRKDFRQLIFNA